MHVLSNTRIMKTITTMKIAHSLIVLSSVIFVTGSMLTVGMDLKATTDNISTNVIEARQKYTEDKESYVNDDKKHEGESNSKLKYNETDQIKAMCKVKLESLNQSNAGKFKNTYVPGKRIENRISID